MHWGKKLPLISWVSASRFSTFIHHHGKICQKGNHYSPSLYAFYLFVTIYIMYAIRGSLVDLIEMIFIKMLTNSNFQLLLSLNVVLFPTCVSFIVQNVLEKFKHAHRSSIKGILMYYNFLIFFLQCFFFSFWRKYLNKFSKATQEMGDGEWKKNH